MKNRYFYKFEGRVSLKANSQSEAEKAVTGITLSDYLIDEDLYQVDENYVSSDPKKREKQFGTIHHPINDPDKFELYKIRKFRYNHIFKDFLNGKIDRQELIHRMDDAKNEKLDDCNTYAEISKVDLDTKKFKTARLVPVD